MRQETEIRGRDRGLALSLFLSLSLSGFSLPFSISPLSVLLSLFLSLFTISLSSLLAILLLANGVSDCDSANSAHVNLNEVQLAADHHLHTSVKRSSALRVRERQRE
jgi:hypothetical protein